MTTMRSIDRIYKAPGIHWVGDGFRVQGYFAHQELQRKLSPFLLLDYHPPYDYPPTDSTRRGVGPHPHRGFETVTVAFAGSVAHRDSTGAGGVIGPGDVQWMTAASGILHREYHEAEFARRGGTLHMAQLWVNLPRAHKLDPPGYQALEADQLGLVRLPHEAGLVRVIAGEYQGVKGPARTFTPISLFEIHLNRLGRVELSLPARENAALLVMKGEVSINGPAAAVAGDFVLFANRGERVALDAHAEAHLLLLGGAPIDEPVVTYGPFAMTTEQEIEQAIQDYNAGKFGHLDE